MAEEDTCLCDLFAAAMDRLPFACFVLDGAGQVVALNLGAASQLAAGVGIAVVSGKLMPSVPRWEDGFRQLMAGETVCALLERSGGMGPLIVQSAAIDAHGARLVTVSVLDDRPVLSAAALAQSFHLTPAEADLAIAVATGASLDQIAARRSVRLVTVRSQLRAVLAKTGTGRQAELAALLAGIPPLAP